MIAAASATASTSARARASASTTASASASATASKLTDVVTSLWLGIIVLSKELFSMR